MSRASLVDAYIAALNLTAIAVVSAPRRRCRIHSTGDLAPGKKIKFQFYFRPSHADLLLATIDKEGLSGKSPAALAGAIRQAAATVGAPIRTASELQAEAEKQVAEIVERVKASNQSGGLRHWNVRYKEYRLSQVSKAEPALPYSAFLERFVITPTVRNVAMTGRMV